MTIDQGLATMATLNIDSAVARDLGLDLEFVWKPADRIKWTSAKMALVAKTREQPVSRVDLRQILLGLVENWSETTADKIIDTLLIAGVVFRKVNN